MVRVRTCEGFHLRVGFRRSPQSDGRAGVAPEAGDVRRRMRLCLRHRWVHEAPAPRSAGSSRVRWATTKNGAGNSRPVVRRSDDSRYGWNGGGGHPLPMRSLAWKKWSQLSGPGSPAFGPPPAVTWSLSICRLRASPHASSCAVPSGFPGGGAGPYARAPVGSSSATATANAVTKRRLPMVPPPQPNAGHDGL